MKFSSAGIRKYSDDRLLNVIVYKDMYNYPFDYIELCKEELRRRGYSNDNILSEVRIRTDEDVSTQGKNRFALMQRIRSHKRVIWLSGIGSPLCFVLLFALDGTIESAQTKKIIGGIALGLFCLFFLAYAHMNLLITQVRRTDQDPSIFAP